MCTSAGREYAAIALDKRASMATFKILLKLVGLPIDLTACQVLVKIVRAKDRDCYVKWGARMGLSPTTRGSSHCPWGWGEMLLLGWPVDRLHLPCDCWQASPGKMLTKNVIILTKDHRYLPKLRGEYLRWRNHVAYWACLSILDKSLSENIGNVSP